MTREEMDALLKEHEELVDALEKKDEERAIEVTCRHVVSQKEHIIAILNQKE